MRKVSTVFALCVVIGLSACASVPKQTLSKDDRSSIKTIAILDVFAPAQYTIINAGGASGFLGGAIGGAMRATTDQGRAEEFTAAMNEHNVQLARAFGDALEAALRKSRYNVIRLPNVQPRSNGTAMPEYAGLTDQADAVLDVVNGCQNPRKNGGKLG